MDPSINQIKFANYLALASSSQRKLPSQALKRKNGETGSKKKNKEARVELPISTEMIELMEHTLSNTDSHGILIDRVGSHLSQPLNSTSLFYPTAAKLESKYTASKFLDSSAQNTKRKREQSEYWLGDLADEQNITFGSSNLRSANLTETELSSGLLKESFSDGLEREMYTHDATLEKPALSSSFDGLDGKLKMLYYQRKADIERENGNLLVANDLMEKALNILFGADLKENSLKDGNGKVQYEKLNLLEPTPSSNPLEILQSIEDEYFLFDPQIHFKAARIQRLYRKHLQHRVDLANKLIKYVRGFLSRNKYLKLRNLRRQCSTLIQRRFRKHLKRMHALATKIKQWYRVRKIVKEYQKKLFIYRKARDIQRVFRGFLGRRKANLMRKRLNAAKLIQRTSRKFLVRSHRHFALSCIHRFIFSSVRKVQTMVRRVQAKQRSQIKLLMEIIRNNLRAEKEKIVISEVLKMVKHQMAYHFKTANGKLQAYFTKRKIIYRKQLMLSNFYYAQQRQHDSFQSFSPYKAISSNLTFVTPELISFLEYYDEFSDGKIAFPVFISMIKSLKIFSFVSEELVFYFKQKLDPNGTNTVYLADFLNWYDSEEADDFFDLYQDWHRTYPGSLPVYYVKQVLHTIVSMLSFQPKKDRKELKLITQEVMNKFYYQYHLMDFRKQHSPKFFCCQCFESFLLFSDYKSHYTLDESQVGVCPTTKLPAFFYATTFHMKHENWIFQKQIEYEIARYNIEQQYLRNHSRAKCYELLNHWNDSKIRSQLSDREKHLFDILYPMIASAKNIKAKFIDILIHYIFLFQSSINLVDSSLEVNQHMNEQGIADPNYYISDILLHILAKLFHLPLKREWILNERLTPPSRSEKSPYDLYKKPEDSKDTPWLNDRIELIRWLNTFLVIDSPMLFSQKTSTVDASYSDNANNKTLAELLPTKDVIEEGYLYDFNFPLVPNIYNSLSPSNDLLEPHDAVPNALSINAQQSSNESRNESPSSRVFLNPAVSINPKVFDSFRSFKQNNRSLGFFPTLTNASYFARITRKLCFAIVRILKCLEEQMSSSLFALLEFREKFERRITVPDEVLNNLKLGNLTEAKFNFDYEFLLKIVDRIRTKTTEIDIISMEMAKEKELNALKRKYEKDSKWKFTFPSSFFAGNGYKPIHPASVSPPSSSPESNFVPTNSDAYQLELDGMLQKYSEESKIKILSRNLVEALFSRSNSQLNLDLQNPLLQFFIIRHYQVPMEALLSNAQLRDLVTSFFQSTIQSIDALLDKPSTSQFFFQVLVKYCSSIDTELTEANLSILDFQLVVNEASRFVRANLPKRKVPSVFPMDDMNVGFVLSLERCFEIIAVSIIDSKLKFMLLGFLSDKFGKFTSFVESFTRFVPHSKGKLTIHGKEIYLHTIRNHLRLQSLVFDQLPRLLSSHSTDIQDSRLFWNMIQSPDSRDSSSTRQLSDPTLFEFSLSANWKDYCHSRRIEKFMFDFDTIADLTTKHHKQLQSFLAFNWKGVKTVNREKMLLDPLEDILSLMLSFSFQSFSIEDPGSLTARGRFLVREIQSSKENEIYLIRSLKSALDVVLHSLDFSAKGYFEYSEILYILKCFNVNDKNQLDKELNTTLQKYLSLLHLNLEDTAERKNPLKKDWNSLSCRENLLLPISYVSGILIDFIWMEVSKKSGSLNFRLKSKRFISRLLISMHCRQLVRKQLDQAYSILAVENQNSNPALLPTQLKFYLKEQIQTDKEMSLIVRCQMLAMRQMNRFLSTFLGKYFLHRTVLQVEYRQNFAFSNFSVTMDPNEKIKQSLLYAIYLHCETFNHVSTNVAKKVLNTELIHIIGFCKKYLNFVFSPAIIHLTSKFKHGFHRKTLHWYSSQDAFSVLFPYIDYEKTLTASVKFEPRDYLRLKVLRDSKVHLESRARQQAVLISMNIEHIRVPETNYRCFVLGLYDLKNRVKIAQFKKQKLHSVEFPGQKLSKDVITSKSVLMETLSYYLFSQGYNFYQISHSSLQERGFVALLPSECSGTFQFGEIDLEKVTSIIQNYIRKEMSYFELFQVSINSLWRKFFYERERNQIEFLLLNEMDSIEKQSAEYLKEILNGNSYIDI